MEPIYQADFKITERDVDCYGRLMPSMILFYAQQVAGMHSTQMTVGYETLENRRMFWAVTRHKVQVTRLPRLGETIHVETWPMPTTRVAYPRSMVAYDGEGNEVFRSISLWVLMDLDTRNMILPGKSGISVVGTLRGNELTVPTGLPAKALRSSRERTVCFTDLDRPGHMNNCPYLDWIADLLPGGCHAGHGIREPGGARPWTCGGTSPRKTACTWTPTGLPTSRTPGFSPPGFCSAENVMLTKKTPQLCAKLWSFFCTSVYNP